MDTTEPYVARACSWAALLAAFILSWTTWVGVGDIAEYGAFRYALPVCVDGYIVTVLMAWIAPRDDRAARFARWNVYLSAGLSILTQSVYHGANVYSHTTTPWKAVIAWLAGALPPLFAALSVHFRTGVRLTAGTPGSAPTAQPGAILPQTEPKPASPVPASTVPAVAFSSPPPVEKSSPAVAQPIAQPIQASTSATAVRNGRVPSARKPPPATRQGHVSREVAEVRERQAWAIFDDELATGVSRPESQICQRVGVGSRQLRRYRTAWKADRDAKATVDA